jgi:hypothetical protein
MDTRTGQTYNSLAAALAAGVPAEHLVTGPAPAIEKLSRLVVEDRERRRTGWTAPRAARALRKAKRAQQRASRKANRR